MGPHSTHSIINSQRAIAKKVRNETHILPGPWRGVKGAPYLKIRPPSLDLRLDVLLVAVGANPMAELGLAALLDIPFDGFPSLIPAPDPLAVLADRQQALELLHVQPQTEDPLGDLEPSAQLFEVDGLRDEVVGPGVHALEIALLPAGGGDENEVRVAIVFAGADAAGPGLGAALAR